MLGIPARPGQAVRDFMLQLSSDYALHLAEWAAKIQIFGLPNY